MVDGTVEGKDNREEKTIEVTNIKMYTVSWNYLYLGCGYGGWHEFFLYIFNISDNLEYIQGGFCRTPTRSNHEVRLSGQHPPTGVTKSPL